MKTLTHRKILAITVAAMIGMATTGGVALARGGGFGGGAHVGSLGGTHLGGLGGSFAGGHVNGLAGPHVGGFGHMGGLNLAPTGMRGHTHISHGLGHHEFRRLYGVSPLYNGDDCYRAADLRIESCPVGSVTE